MNVEKLRNAGIEYENGVHRLCGKEDLYQRFLKKFIEDESFNELKMNIEQNRYAEAFKCAHTLKGIAGNLSMERLYEPCCELVEVLRNGQYDAIDEFFKQVSEAYEKVIEAIKAD